jgi:Ca-activated chloride channel homolog
LSASPAVSRSLLALAVLVAISCTTRPRTEAGPPAFEAPSAPPEPGAISTERSFYVVFDGSGSMTASECAGQFGSRIEAARWAVKEFVSKSVPAEVNLGFFAFDREGATERVPLGKGNRDRLLTAVDGVRGGGETPLNASIKTAVAELYRQRERQLGYGEFYVVVATDGEPTDGDLQSSAVRYANQFAIPIITIGFCLRSSHPLAQGSLSYRNANNPQELLSALSDATAESTYFDATVFRRN